MVLNIFGQTSTSIWFRGWIGFIVIVSAMSCQPAQIDATLNGDVASACGDVMTSDLTPSDQQDPIGIGYGYDRPFVSAIPIDTSPNLFDLPIEYGLQGGHHVDLSLRFVGDFNPDLVDLYIRLVVDAPLTDRFSGSHDTRAWYLLFSQSVEPEGCYFHRARIFLFDDSGAPVQTLGVSELHGSQASLDITLTTQDAVHRWQTRGVLRDQTGQF